MLGAHTPKEGCHDRETEVRELNQDLMWGAHTNQGSDAFEPLTATTILLFSSAISLYSFIHFSSR